MLISLSRFVYTLHLNIVIRIHVFFFDSIQKSDLIKKTTVIHTYKDLSSLEIRVEFCVFVVKIWKIMLSTMVCHWSNYCQLLDYEILEYSLSSVNYVICQLYVCVFVWVARDLIKHKHLFESPFNLHRNIYMCDYQKKRLLQLE